MQAALDRHQRKAGYMYSLLTGRHFLKFRNVLEGKTGILREKGKGNHPNKICNLSNDKIDQLWQSGRFGYHLP